MNPELDSALCERHPLIFAYRHASVLETTMSRGFECGDGWYPLIDVLCEQLQYATEHDAQPQIVASQVKEKLGGLRFYALGASQNQRAMIRLTQAMSLRLCEICGASGLLRNDAGIWSTRCIEHRAMPDEAGLSF